ncbi:MAG: nucleoside hydrolase [Bacteroidota bacterium]|nr:nucleoside hydrolase [Bacteroidota bacterium]
MNNYISLIVIAILVTFSNHILVEKEKFGGEGAIAIGDFDFGKRTIDENLLSTTAIETPIMPALIRPKNTNPIKIIFDTDMDSDVDDVGALAMLHAMMTNGEVEILAVMVSSTCPSSAACADAVNTYYGRPDIPIGVKKGNGVNRDSGYVSKVAGKFPENIGSRANACDSKVLYRQILAGSPDKSVIIVNVGYFTNLKDLLKTPGDSISDLNGRDLVNAKVTELVGTGGEYPRDLSFQENGNFEPDGKAVKYVNEHWPTMLTFVSGEQYFWDVKTGAALLEEDMNVNPVAFAYKEFYTLVSWDRLYPDHHSADQIGVYVAVRGFENEYILTKTTGYFHIWDNGLCEWRTDSEIPLRRITYSLKDPYWNSAARLADIIETLMLQKP